MEHLLLKAAVTAATDQGTFTAVISAASIDREKDIVDPAGMVRALHKWVPTGKKIPLAWNHSGAAEDQIGYIDPSTAKAVGGEVVATGWIDQSSEVGQHAWRLVKAGTLGFSFGYLTLDSSPRKGGGRLLKELDVFEVTATPTPMNNDTRVLGWKAATVAERVMAATPDDEQAELDTLKAVIGLMDDFLATEDDEQDIAAARDVISRVQGLLNTEGAEPPEKAIHVKDLTFEQLPQAVKDRCVEEAQRMLTAEKTADATGKESETTRPADSLKSKARALSLEVQSGGISLQPPRQEKAVEEQTKPGPDLPPDELREYSRQLMVQALTGIEEA